MKSKDHYGRSKQGPMQVGARPRSILDQTGAVALTSLFIDSIQLGEKIVEFPTETRESLLSAIFFAPRPLLLPVLRTYPLTQYSSILPDG